MPAFLPRATIVFALASSVVPGAIGLVLRPAASFHRRHCSLNRRPQHAELSSSSLSSVLALEGGRYTFDACNSIRAKDLSLVRIRQPSVASSDPCAHFSGNCAWTAKYSCPGQTPIGSLGEATDDGRVGYRCCCTYQKWKQATSLSDVDPGSDAGAEHPLESSTGVFSSDSETNASTPLQQVVWVSGYPRSGSSTMLSMVSAAGGHVDAREPGHTFSLFEPCHNGDEVSPQLEVTGCMGLLGSISNCQFSDVHNLWGWADPHSTNNRSKFSSETATEICKQSDVIAFKTVDFAHDLRRYTSMLDAMPRMKVLDIVRDPRGIWGSWKTTEPFNQLLAKGTFYTLLEICDSFAANLELNHSQVHHVVFEHLVSKPTETTAKVYKFLGLPFEEPQQAWVDRTFDAKECPPPPPGIPEEFTDCHRDSAAKAEKWRDILTADELASFNASPACKKVVEYYGYPA